MTGVEVDVFAEFKAALGKVTEAMNGQQKQLQRLARKMQQPTCYPLVDSLTVDANGNAPLLSRQQSGPDMGHFWHIRSIAVGGLTPTTTVAGRADVFATPMIPGPVPNYQTLLGTANWRDFEATLPNIAFYGPGEMSIFPQDELIILVSGATTGQIVVCNIVAWDYEQGAAGQEWAI